MKIRTHIGVSLDGFVAGPDGMPTWVSTPGWSHAGSHGYPEFSAQNEAVIVGRKTFDQGHHFWEADGGWPWEGTPVYVLTSHPLPEKRHADVYAPGGGVAGIVEHLRGAGLQKDVQLLGGGQAIRAFLDAGAIDELGIVLVPIVLGGGAPLWESGVTPRTLHLARQRPSTEGAVELVYTLG